MSAFLEPRSPVLRFACCLLVLLFALPGLAEEAPTKRAIFLVAKKDMRDPNFRDTVVLVTNHSGLAPIGVVVNRQTEIPLSTVFPDMEKLRKRDGKLFIGGPVKRDEVVFIFRAATPPKDAIEILDGVYLSGSHGVLKQLLERDEPLEGLRVFAGYAGWAPGQLENEIARGDWHLAPVESRALFDARPERLRPELYRRAAATKVRLPLD